MRKTITLLTCIILTLFAFAIPAQAAPTHKATFVVGQASYTIDGQTKQMDAKTFIENSRTYVPVRYLGDALGAETGWDEGTRTVTVTLDSKVVKLVIDSKTLNIDGQAKQMDAAPLIKDGRTYLPARWVAEAFGYTVRWNAQNRTVYAGPPVEIGTYPFPAKLIKLEMEVGSKKAAGTRPDGSKVEITLPEAPYLVVKSKESRDWRLGINTPQDIANNDVLPKETVDFWKSHASSIVIDSKVTTPAMYIPFAVVAEAFGVPEQNMVWDGEKLRVYARPDWSGMFTPGSKEILWTGEWGPEKKAKMYNPVRIKNSMLVIAAEDIQGGLFSMTKSSLIDAYPGRSDSGVLTGKPVLEGEL